MDVDVPLTVVGDIVRIRQVLLNLVNNAAKFTDNGTITVSVSLEKVEGRRRESMEGLVGLKKRSDDQVLVRYSVTDTGVGIAPHVQTKLFEAFMQVGGGGSKAAEGDSIRCGGVGWRVGRRTPPPPASTAARGWAWPSASRW